MGGTFEVTSVIALAYDNVQGRASYARAIGRVVNEPDSLALAFVALELIGLFGNRLGRVRATAEETTCCV
jgi:hypothetical protein